MAKDKKPVFHVKLKNEWEVISYAGTTTAGPFKSKNKARRECARLNGTKTGARRQYHLQRIQDK